MEAAAFNAAFWFGTILGDVSKEESSVDCRMEALDLGAPVCLHSFW